MLYEKKMLILSGDGKGVVLIEKGGNGVTFSLRTFDLPNTVGLKAGIVTRTAVFVRDLPDGRNPSVRFTVDAGDISYLHFAVFDKRLRLYGTNAKRMWEANLMDLLQKHDRNGSAVVGARPEPPPLPPISPAAQALPMPDGSGIPQSRLALYGDEAIAQSDFYTTLDLSSGMTRVDKFLDEPRILESIAPRIVPPPNVAARDLPAAETTAAVQEVTPSIAVEQESETTDNGAGETTEVEVAQEFARVDNKAEEEKEVDTVLKYDGDEENDVPNDTLDTAAETTATDRETIEESEQTATENETIESVRNDVRAVAYDDGEIAAAENKTASAGATMATERDMPWQITASWLKNRTKRDLKIRRDTVKKVRTTTERVRYLRESEFFERARNDIESLFSSAPKDERLQKLLPDIDWVKVEFDGNVISVGRSGNVFLCYAVAGTYSKDSPLGEQSQWLPSDKRAPTGDGYWLIFQSLESGEILR